MPKPLPPRPKDNPIYGVKTTVEPVDKSTWRRYMLQTEREEFAALTRVERAICDQLIEIRKRKRKLELMARSRHRHDTKERAKTRAARNLLRPSLVDGLALVE